VRIRASVSFCLSVFSFLFYLLDAIAQNEVETRENKRERKKGNSMMMPILWHRTYIERKKEKAQKSVEKERTLPGFFFFSSIL